jgi:phage/plasmid-like protein (TIGR03299 family)
MTAFALQDQLNWEVSKKQLFFLDQTGAPVAYDQKMAVVRGDNDYPLGVVAPSYEPLQNADLKQLVAPMVEEGVLTVENQGFLSKGAKVFIQLRINKDFEVIGESYKGYLTLLNSHNGTGSVAIGPAMQRCICSNTFQGCYNDIGEKFRHHQGVTERVLNTTAITNFVDEAMKVYASNVETLASTRCTGAQFREALETIYNKPVDKMRDKFFSKMNHLFYSGAGNQGRNFYDAFNACTEWSNHHAKKTKAGNVFYSQFGQGATINRRAMQVLTEMAAV